MWIDQYPKQGFGYNAAACASVERDVSAKNPDVRVAVSGGGSGTGVAGLINGVVDVANCVLD